MKKIMAAILVLMLTSVSSAAALEAIRIEPYKPIISEQYDKVLELAAYGAIDYRQTTSLIYGQGFYELNPILGKDPTRGDLFVFGAAAIAAAVLAVEILPESWADVVLDSAIATEKMNIEENAIVEDGRSKGRYTMLFVVTTRF